MKSNLHKKISFALLISCLLFTSTQLPFAEAKSETKPEDKPVVNIEGIVDRVENQSMTIEVTKIGKESLKVGESSPQYTVDLTSTLFFKVIHNKKIPLSSKDLNMGDMVFLKGVVNGKTIKATEVIVAVPVGRYGEEIDPKVLSERASSSRLVGDVIEVKGNVLKVLDYARRNLQNDISLAVVQIDVSKATVQRDSVFGSLPQRKVSSSSEIVVGDMVSSAGSFVNGVMISTDIVVIPALPHTKEHVFKEPEISKENLEAKNSDESVFQKSKKWILVKFHNLFSW